MTALGATRTSRRRLAVRSHLLPVAVGGAAYVALMTWLLQKSYDIAGGIVVAHVLALVTVPVLLALNRRDADRRFRRILVAALAAKLGGTLLRFVVIISVYEEGDALDYHRVGSNLAEFFRQGDFTVDLGQRVVGTGFVELVTGIVYAVTGSTLLGGFLVFSWLGFWGLYLFFSAFRMAFPQGDHRRYAYLVFFLPSMLFWPSSIGKDAWMTLMLGAFAYGVARLVGHRGRALPWIALGTLGTAMVRPHVTLVAVAGLIVAFLLTGSKKASFGRPLAKAAGLLALIVVFSFALGAVESYFRLDDSTSYEQVLDRTEERTSKGGSEFSATGVRSPAQLPLGVFSVIFRPLPFEASNAQAFLASLEGVLLLVLFARNWRRLGNFFPRRGAPYLAFAATYSLLFAIAFSNLSNFGILARQRTQLFPFLLMALAVPLIRRKHTSAGMPTTVESRPPVPATARRSHVGV